MTRCELVKGLRVAESMVGLARSGIPATLGFRKDKRPIHAFSTFCSAQITSRRVSVRPHGSHLLLKPQAPKVDPSKDRGRCGHPTVPSG